MLKTIFIGIMTLFLLSGCSDPNVPIIERETKIIENQIAGLKSALNNNTVPNAVILKTYIEKTKISHPEYNDVLAALMRQTNAQSSGVAKLEDRLNTIHVNLSNGVMTSEDAVLELANLMLASRSDIFNDSLVDEINTVAALSGGLLLPIDQPAGEQPTPGAHLVGNPNYGEWRSSALGSFWQWYGMYSMFNNVFGRPAYDRWYYDRPWSYGYDVYNNRYGSSRWKYNENQTMSRNYERIRSYGRSTNRKASNYAIRGNRQTQIRANGEGSRLSDTRRKTASYGPSATRKSSPYASSSRSGTRSRSSRGGK